MIYQNILETIGKTPIIKINRLSEGLACELYVKCEFFNPGGSVKDRIGYEMVKQAERDGVIKPGDTLIEPTSGNTGIGIALAGAVLGYNVIITMPEKMSQEKQFVLERLGATIYRTPTEAAWNDPDSHISLAKKLQQEIPNAHILDQYANPYNPNAHYYGTAQEIIDDFGTDLHMVVAGVGTGGTITGIAKRLKEFNPDIKIIGVDPIGSILGGGQEVKPYHVEGIGYDFFPEVLDNKLIDGYIKINDTDSFITARRLIREEGLLIGGSSGAAMWGALQAAKTLSKGQKCLVILPDSIRNYMSKFVSDTWMKAEGFSVS
ncbi:pyridoxal-phosphate dependent enzyme [Legionella gresilensis]|uniref:pyridoxal-phosphate dependent enzyme n=1 Tax=Legionella gresilensis TaxID=91823 RepID=UPI0010417F9E|nr:pyridoxal-phosphate dependent enzyme [Legionella gresilensis]